jgi:hypothetical protein
MNKKIILVSFILFLSIITVVVQYISFLQSEIARAYTSGKPANGHFWSEMECTSDLCVKTGSGIGIGTDNPSKKLDVVGDINSSGKITAATDMCIGSGACLSELNNYIGSQGLIYSAHTFNMCSTTPDNSGYGEVLNVGTTAAPVYICKFDASGCPTGISGQPAWTQYQSFSASSAVTCQMDSYTCSYCGCHNCSPCTTGYHSWGNTARESCTYYGYNNIVYGSCDSSYCMGVSCGATFTQIGCY